MLQEAFRKAGEEISSENDRLCRLAWAEDSDGSAPIWGARVWVQVERAGAEPKVAVSAEILRRISFFQRNRLGKIVDSTTPSWLSRKTTDAGRWRPLLTSCSRDPSQVHLFLLLQHHDRHVTHSPMTPRTRLATPTPRISKTATQSRDYFSLPSYHHGSIPLTLLAKASLSTTIRD